MAKPRVCILSFSDVAWDARVLREIDAASNHYDVDVIGYGNWDGGKINHFFSVPKQVKRTLASIFSKYVRVPLGYINPDYWEQHYWQLAGYRPALEIVLREKYDLIHANDWNALPVAGQAARQVGSRVLFDAHEYTPAQAAERLMIRLFTLPVRVYILKTYQECITKAITVSEGLRHLYLENFGWSAEVIMNAPYYVKSEFHSVRLREIHLVHHGGAMRARHLEDLIHLTKVLDARFILDFVLLPSEPKYLAYLRSLAGKIAPNKISFHNGVPPQQLSQKLSGFDIGIPWLRPSNLNHINALPNKFFDYVMAGLGVAVSPLPSMRKIVEEHKIGVIARDQSIQAMADALNSLTVERINEFKQSSLKLATVYNAEHEMKKLMKIYEELLVQ